MHRHGRLSATAAGEASFAVRRSPSRRPRPGEPPMPAKPKVAVVKTRPETVLADVGRFELVDTPHSHASAAKAVALVQEGKAQLLMKGSLHTDELMAEVVRKEGGLRTERRISHCFLMAHPCIIILCRS